MGMTGGERKLCHNLQRHRNARQLKGDSRRNGDKHARNRRPAQERAFRARKKAG